MIEKNKRLLPVIITALILVAVTIWGLVDSLRYSPELINEEVKQSANEILSSNSQIDSYDELMEVFPNIVRRPRLKRGTLENICWAYEFCKEYDIKIYSQKEYDHINGFIQQLKDAETYYVENDSISKDDFVSVIKLFDASRTDDVTEYLQTILG